VIHIVGGTYLETCNEPNWDSLFGSGGRAAAALSRLSKSVIFHTYIDEQFQAQSKLLSESFGYALNPTRCSQTPWFHYEHGLAVPDIRPTRHKIQKEPSITVTGDIVLCFGMLEGNAVVSGDRVIYDPQSAEDPEPFHNNGSSANELAIIANTRESLLLTGKDNFEAAAKALLQNDRTAVVVIKQGSKGCLVVTDKETTRIPAFKTHSVWPIGSGDVFAAAFAYYWGELKLPPMGAAINASKSTAYYCSTKLLPLPKIEEIPQDVVLNEIKPQSKISGAPEYDVYLAGPFFDMGQRWMIDQARQALGNQGLKVFSPLHDVGRGKGPDVAPKDLEGLNKSKVLFAIIDNLDTGTIFEIGYARARGIPVIALSQAVKEEDLKMIIGSRCEVVNDFVTGIYKTAWAYLES